MPNPRGRPPKKSPVFNRPIKDVAPAPLSDKEPLPNFDLLNEADKEELRLKAKARVEARERERAMQAFLEAEEDRLERELHPEAFEELQDITIDVAIYADRIVLDGKHYMHGRTYKDIPKSRCDVMRDVMSRTYKHYADTHRDPSKAMMEAQQAIAKGGHSYATINAQSGQVTRF